MKKNIIMPLFAISLLLCSCGEKETGTVYEKPQPNPTRVTVEQIGQTSQVSVTWVDNATSETGYAVWVKTGSNAAQQVADLAPNSEAYTIESGLVAGNSYSIGVQARGKEDKVSSMIVYKEISIFDWDKLPNSILKDEIIVTPSSIAVEYNFKNSNEFEKEAWGLCWSSEHTPTLEDAHAHGPNIAALPMRQAIPVSCLEYGKTYKVRGYVTCSKGTMYSNEITVSLGEEVPALKFNWTPVETEGMHEDIKVYKTTDKINGRNFNAWYAIADVTKGNVEFRFEFNSSVQLMSKYYSNNKDAGETVYVMTNAGYFNMTTGKTGDYHVDKGVVDNSTASTTARGTFGVDKDQKPYALWGGKGAGDITYFYDNPVMTLGSKSTYSTLKDNYPENNVMWEPYYAMTAGPLLVKNGQIMPDVTAENGVFVRNYENIYSDIFNDSTVIPDRTCVGYTEDGKIILFVCDGRITISQGASIVEAAQIMKGLGCVGAVNFDGGGSTAMLVMGERVNSLLSNTSGATENRAVGSIMGFYLKK